MYAQAYGFGNDWPMLVTLAELKHGAMTPARLKMMREVGGLKSQVVLTANAESMYKSLTNQSRVRDVEAPAEQTLLGHVCWIRELRQFGTLNHIQGCDLRYIDLELLQPCYV